MFIAEVRFLLRKKDQREEEINRAGLLLSAWRWNGQIAAQDWVTVVRRNRFIAFVPLLAEDSLSERFANRWVRESLSKLSDLGVASPEVKVLGQPEEPSLVCCCDERPSLILFTHMFRPESPIRCGGCSGIVPLYRLPKTDANDGYTDIFAWQSAYQACDCLQIGCGAGERFGARQMADFNSPLTKQGLATTARIEEVTGAPTYYYLHKHFGRSDARERARVCPSCGGKWLLEEPWQRLFDFRCEPCRLLSNIAFDLRR